MTTEDDLLQRVQAILAANRPQPVEVPIPQPAANDPYQPPVSSNHPILPIDSPHVAPPNVGDPYRFQAEDYVKQAGDIERQAAPPAGPTSLGGKIAEGLRAGLEGFTGGLTRGPGYFEHQQARDQQEQQREAGLYARAKSLREEAARQQQLGINEEHNRDQFELTKSLRDLEQRRQQFAEDQANNPKPFTAAPGASYGHVDTATGAHTVEGTVPARTTAKEPMIKKVEDHGQLFNVFYNPEAPYNEIKREPAGPYHEAGGGAAGTVIVQGTVDGKPTPGVADKKTQTWKPLHQAGQTTTLEGPEQGRANVKANATAISNSQDAEQLYNTMKDTVARIEGGKSTAIGADDLVLLSNHMAMTFGAVKGARLSRDLIKAHEEARSIGDGFLVRAIEQYQNGSQLSPGQRHEFLHLAEQRVGELKRKEAATAARLNGGQAAPTPASGWTVEVEK